MSKRLPSSSIVVSLYSTWYAVEGLGLRSFGVWCEKVFGVRCLVCVWYLVLGIEGFGLAVWVQIGMVLGSEGSVPSQNEKKKSEIQKNIKRALGFEAGV